MYNKFRKLFTNTKIKVNRLFCNKRTYYYFDTKNTQSETVLFFHGTGNDALYPNLELFFTLLENNYNIISCDLDGHGKNSATVIELHTIRQQVENIYADIKQLQLKAPEIALGYSLGAALLVNYVTNNKNILKKIVTISLPLNLELKSIKLLTEALTFISPSFFRQLKYYTLFEILPAILSFKRTEFPIRYKSKKQQHYIAFIEEIIALLETKKNILKVDIPVLNIHGSLDYITKINNEDKNYLSKNEFIKNMTYNYYNHFNILFSQKAHKDIINFMKVS